MARNVIRIRDSGVRGNLSLGVAQWPVLNPVSGRPKDEMEITTDSKSAV